MEMCTWPKAVVIFVALTLITLVSCSTANHKLPADWPIPELTLPPDSKIVAEVVVEHGTTAAGNGGMWYVFFDCPHDLSSMAAYIEQCLGPLNFEECYWKHPVCKSRDIDRTYYSKDRKYRVTLKNDTGMSVFQLGECRMTVYVSSEPNPQLSKVIVNSQEIDYIVKPISN